MAYCRMLRQQVIMRFHLIFIGILTICGHPVLACSCIGESSVKQSVKGSDLVVIGRVLSGDKFTEVDSTWLFGKDSSGNNRYFSYNKMHYIVLVTTKFKGTFHGDTISIRTGMGGGDCGYQFNIGGDYIIYGYKNSERLSAQQIEFTTNLCSRTRPANDKFEIAAIKNATRKRWRLAH